MLRNVAVCGCDDISYIDFSSNYALPTCSVRLQICYDFGKAKDMDGLSLSGSRIYCILEVLHFRSIYQ